MLAKNSRIKIMNIKELKQQGFLKAAALARGDCLDEFYYICETQKTISTRKLEYLLNAEIGLFCMLKLWQI
jgi:hypothetical protein